MRELEKHTLSLQLLILKVELQRERAGEIERSAIYGVHLPRGHNRWNRYRPELGAGLSEGGWSPKTHTILCCFPSLLSRELDLKWSRQDLNWHPGDAGTTGNTFTCSIVMQAHTLFLNPIFLQNF